MIEEPAGTSAAQLGPASEDRQANPIIYRVSCERCQESEVVTSSRQGVEWARRHYAETGHLVEGVKPLNLLQGPPPRSLEDRIASIEHDVAQILALHRALAQGMVELGKLGPLKMVMGIGQLGAVLREVDSAGSGGGPQGIGPAGVVQEDSQGHGGRDPGPAGGVGGG